MVLMKKLNQYSLLAGMCAGITFLPVLNHCLAVPGELLLTLTAWFLSNCVIAIALFIYSRFLRPTHKQM
jgi:hypothetical protein